MAKEVKFYRCEICDKQFAKKTEAEKCENAHFIPKSVDTPIYNHNDSKIVAR